VRRRRVILGNHLLWGGRLRLDPQALDWLRSKGEGPLTRINSVVVGLTGFEAASGRGDGLKLPHLQ
jgi:hypothetical protein